MFHNILSQIFIVKSRITGEIHAVKKRESFMKTRAKISAKISASMRASGGAAFIRGWRLLTFLSQMRRLFEGGAYSSKYAAIIGESKRSLLWLLTLRNLIYPAM